MSSSKYPVELQSGFVDASVLLRKTDAVVALMFSDRSTCEVYLVKEHPVKGFSYELDSSFSIDRGNYFFGKRTFMVIYSLKKISVMALFKNAYKKLLKNPYVIVFYLNNLSE